MKLIILKSRLRNYPIIIDRGITAKAADTINKYFFNSEKIILVTNDKILSIYESTIKKLLSSTNRTTHIIVLKDGEEQKNLENTEYIYQNLINFNTHRNDLIIAFGGGVIGDIAGFAASTFHRGINLLQFPTTIIAQLDSSIGGKVAVNYKDIKNIIGSFYQPNAVLIDPELLETLQEREIINGLAEIVKYGILFDKRILGILKKITVKAPKLKELSLYAKLNLYTDTENKEKDTVLDETRSSYLNELIKSRDFERIIYKCVKIKSAVVKKDEFDTGYRNLLNFGHTIGHAIEKVKRLKDISHGEAVALGMIVAADISIELGLAKESLKNKLVEIYNPLKLPYTIPNINVNELISSLKFDKKFLSSQNKFILLRYLNKPVFRYNIEEDIIRKSILKNMPTEKLNEKCFNN
ncbi:MAG: 3-dehydroquinate synthase [Actinobacteria bacterium]|nr:3-dehydroquinate synthase [Actinomycetota bacterium]MBM3713476.1 3-dehydroquinate synthase [Actinomycetota bacterium]